MKQWIKIACSILILVCFSCDSHQRPEYVKIAYKITYQTAKKLRREKGLFLFGTGGGMINDIKIMSMDFHFYRPLAIEAFRSLLLYAVEEYLAAINGNEEVRPYLHNYPFTPNNVEISIFLLNRDGSSLPPGEIDLATARLGEFVYFSDDMEAIKQGKDLLKKVHVETFEEAVQICRRQEKERSFSTQATETSPSIS